jgi:uncharacterized membrane protein
VFQSIEEFVGHFHPLLVHLPIGILLTALLLQWLSSRGKNNSFEQAVPIVLLCGTITALVSCITGYLLSISDDYNRTLVNWHQWMGISLTFTSFLLYAKEKNDLLAINKKFLSVGLLVLIFITGHLGGSLTHGSDYLSKPLADIFGKDSAANTTIRPLPNVQQALAYNDVIRPILQTKCYTCHGPNKQKGKLRMDDEVMLMKGGKDGKVIEPGNGDSSKMIQRLLLPVDNEDHMPPKEKPQPTEGQIALLRWWISAGADFTKKVSEIPQPDLIKPVLLALQKAPSVKTDFTDIPGHPVEKADDRIIEQLKQKGVVVLPVAQNTYYLTANFVTDTLVRKEELQLLLSLKKQLIWLKLGNTNVSDTAMAIIGQLDNLTRLSLDHAAISDRGLKDLIPLHNLRYFNLVGTKVTAAGVLQLKGMKSLHSLYLFQTNVNKADWAFLQKEFPKTRLDSGGYTVPLLLTDTEIVKPKNEH